MSKADQSQRLLRMIESEERKDSQQVEKIKQDYISQITKLKKEEMFPIPKKLSLFFEKKKII